MRSPRLALVATFVSAVVLVAACSGGASAPEPFTVSDATISDELVVRGDFDEYASQWRELLATDGFRYDTAAGVAQNMTTSETALVDSVLGFVGSLASDLAAYTSRAGSDADAAAVEVVEASFTTMSSVVGELPSAREAVLACFLAATVDDECVTQQNRLSELITTLEEALDGLPLVAGAGGTSV
jgi:hypothetical protein